MLHSTRYFENPFEDKRITPTRLREFSSDVVNRLSAAQSATTISPWDTLIKELSTATNAVSAEISAIDTAVNIRLGHTDTVDEIMNRFRMYMLDNEPYIAKPLGGRGSTSYLAFYPHGTAEYTRARKTDMPTLTARVAAAAHVHGSVLGEPYTADLLLFASDYAAARKVQQTVKGLVSETRAERTAAVKALSVVLHRAMHTIALALPGDEKACLAYFDFSMLTTRRRHAASTPPDDPPVVQASV